MTPRRVAYVVNTFPKVSETFVVDELAELRRRGVEVRVLSLNTPRETLRHGSVEAAGLLERTRYTARAFQTELDSFVPQLLHAHFATEPTGTARALAAERGVPFTFTAHGYDVYRRPPTDFAARAAAAAAVITVSDANGRHIAQTWGVPAGRLHVVPCGVDTDLFTPGSPETTPPLVVAVARLKEVKQLDLLLRACALVRDRGTAFRCVVIGEGPERQALEALRAALDLEDVVSLPGAADHGEVLRWWRRAAVAALSSRSEGMPVSLMEAAACGVPQVAPGVGGIPELIADGMTGFVTTPGDPDALAGALGRLLGDEALRRRMGRHARSLAEARFSRTRHIDDLLAIWSRVLS